jgi:hypothetical protein
MPMSTRAQTALENRRRRLDAAEREIGREHDSELDQQSERIRWLRSANKGASRGIRPVAPPGGWPESPPAPVAAKPGAKPAAAAKPATAASRKATAAPVMALARPPRAAPRPERPQPPIAAGLDRELMAMVYRHLDARDRLEDAAARAGLPLASALVTARRGAIPSKFR